MLKFDIAEGKNQNYLLQKNNINLHLLLTENTSPEDNARIYFLFPENNSGVGLLLSSGDPDAPCIKIKLINDLFTDKFPDTTPAVTAELAFNTNKITFTRICMDSVRAIRDMKYPEAYEKREAAKTAFFKKHGMNDYVRKEPLITNKCVIFVKKGCDFANKYYLKIEFPRGTRVEYEDGQLNLESETKLKLIFTVSYTGERLIPFREKNILNRESTAFYNRLQGKAKKNFDNSLRTFRFLAFRKKLLAGSWSFLTYFGRDTLITGMMLKNTVVRNVYKTILQGAIDRISDDGVVAHEEDIGDQAGYRHICEASGQARKLDTSYFNKPVYDYKMIDDDFLFPVALAQYLADPEIPAGDKNVFLGRMNGRDESNLETICRNFNFILDSCDKKSLIKIKDRHAGNWRDSDIGLGNGKYPMDVNAFLAPAALKAIEKSLSSIHSLKLEPCGKYGALKKAAADSGFTEGLIDKWEKVKNRFIVRITGKEITAALEDFAGKIKDPAEKKYILETKIGGVKVSDLISSGKMPERLSDGFRFFSLSLDEQEKPVKVVNSDISYCLFLGEPDMDDLGIMLDSLELNYPLGLASDIGIFCTNPALSGSDELQKRLDRKGYHGSVVWAWQHYMIELGLARQIRRFSGQDDKKAVVTRMTKLLAELEKMLDRAEQFLSSELWSWKIKNNMMAASAYGEEQGSETESNAVQLWSSALMGVMKEIADL